MKKKRIIFLLILNLIILVFSFIAFSKIYNINTKNNKNQTIIKENNKKTNISEPIKEETITPIDINELRKKYNNSDIIGVLKIDSINLESIITKTYDNSYYLNHSLYKNKSDLGTEFIDYRNKNDLINEKQINIYGHNTDNIQLMNQLQFHKLEKILKKEEFDKLGKIILYIDNNVIVYEKVLIKIITTDYEYTRLEYISDEEYYNHINNLLSNVTNCIDNCSINNDIIILQTCYYTPENSFILLVGQKINNN